METRLKQFYRVQKIKSVGIINEVYYHFFSLLSLESHFSNIFVSIAPPFARFEKIKYCFFLSFLSFYF